MDTAPLYKNTYRVPSTRWRGWDYSANGVYFITICTKDRQCFFGFIKDRAMHYTELGVQSGSCWLDIPNHFPFVTIDEFVVMPNHVHGVLHINKRKDPIVEAQGVAHLQRYTPTWKMNEFGVQSGNLASIVRGYKIGVTMYAKMNNLSFAWQSRYHDHVIRDEFELNRIRKYIRENPQNWEDDDLHVSRE